MVQFILKLEKHVYDLEGTFWDGAFGDENLNLIKMYNI
jgi:hypothetical protein